jgi:hypothetical protein
MTLAGWLMMGLCWTLVTGFSGYLVYKTLRTPRHHDDAPAP